MFNGRPVSPGSQVFREGQVSVSCDESDPVRGRILLKGPPGLPGGAVHLRVG